MTSRYISLALAFLPIVACSAVQSPQVVADSGKAVMTAPTSEVAPVPASDAAQDESLIAQSHVSWLSSGFYSLRLIRNSDSAEFHTSYVYVDSPRPYQIDVYKTIDIDPFGSLARCGGLGCGLERGALTASLQFRSTGSNQFVVESATGTAAFLQGTQCTTQMLHDWVLSCTSPTGPTGSFPSTIEFRPGT
ncbi:hypothetical protein [Leptolyngbya sp. CCY15150]|uniref:hypothetical protein n=1 Tax=Leptolyngbya sp. CCY15150 TaxID=2767772 RepID=UPI001951A843|nr:hypothetical protein [Leptolyngbya sp. CCY15150]